MNVGTRVHHRHYGHLIGVVVGRPDPSTATVKWNGYLGAPLNESVQILRATPVQP